MNKYVKISHSLTYSYKALGQTVALIILQTYLRETSQPWGLVHPQILNRLWRCNENYRVSEGLTTHWLLSWECLLHLEIQNCWRLLGNSVQGQHHFVKKGTCCSIVLSKKDRSCHCQFTAITFTLWWTVCSSCRWRHLSLSVFLPLWTIHHFTTEKMQHCSVDNYSVYKQVSKKPCQLRVNLKNEELCKPRSDLRPPGAFSLYSVFYSWAYKRSRQKWNYSNRPINTLPEFRFMYYRYLIITIMSPDVTKMGFSFCQEGHSLQELPQQ